MRIWPILRKNCVVYVWFAILNSLRTKKKENHLFFFLIIFKIGCYLNRTSWSSNSYLVSFLLNNCITINYLGILYLPLYLNRFKNYISFSISSFFVISVWHVQIALSLTITYISIVALICHDRNLKIGSMWTA